MYLYFFSSYAFEEQLMNLLSLNSIKKDFSSLMPLKEGKIILIQQQFNIIYILKENRK